MPLDPLLKNKYILVVDDEEDIVESLAELLDECKIDKALNFRSAEKLLMKTRMMPRSWTLWGWTGTCCWILPAPEIFRP